MFPALVLAFGDLPLPRVLGVLARSLVYTLLVFSAIAVLFGWALTGADPCGLVGLDACVLDAGAGGLGAVVLAALLGWLLFPAVALGVIAGMGDRVVAAVEAEHYPEAARDARPLGAGGAALLALRSSARLLLLNLAALPFYLILLVTGIGPLILFLLVNGLGAGRDLGELVAWRHGDRASRSAWLRATRSERLALGIACAALFLVPVLNLLAPVVGAAAATHLYHRRVRAAPRA